MVSATAVLSMYAVMLSRPPEQADYWAAPCLTTVPDEYQTRLHPAGVGQAYHALGDGEFLPEGEWAVCSVYYVHEDDPAIPPPPPRQVGRLAVHIRSGEHRLLIAPQPVARFHFELSRDYYEPALSPSAAAVVVECRPNGPPPSEGSMPGRQLLWSWTPVSGKIRPVGNSVPVQSLLRALHGTPYDASWLDRERENWSGWVRVFSSETGRMAADLEVAKPWSFQGTKAFSAVYYAPGAEPHHVLQISKRSLPERQEQESVLSCLDLREQAHVRWQLDGNRIRELWGGDVDAGLLFVKGIARPVKNVPLLAIRRGESPKTELWVLDPHDGARQERYHLQNSSRYAFFPFVSANGRYVASSLEDGRLHLLDLEREVVLYNGPLLKRLFPSLHLRGIANDGTVILQSSASVLTFGPPYGEDPKVVFSLPRHEDDRRP